MASQSSLDSFAVPAASLVQQRHDRELERAAFVAWQKERAGALDLPWPPPVEKRKVGRPPRRKCWERALLESIRVGDCPTDVQREVPTWWSVGMRVYRSEADAEAEAEREAEHEPQEEHDFWAEPEAPVETEEWDAPRKRAKRHAFDPAVKGWFVSLAHLHPDWSIIDCIRYARRMAPDLFKGHIDAPRKWLRDQEKKSDDFWGMWVTLYKKWPLLQRTRSLSRAGDRRGLPTKIGSPIILVIPSQPKLVRK